MIDFLAIGHITHDRTPDGIRLGGTVSFAAIAALRLGHRPGILTRGSAEGFDAGCNDRETGLQPSICQEGPFAGIAVQRLPSPVSTTFVNIYQDGRRTQYVEAVAGPITPSDLPDSWESVPVVLLGPLAGELPVEWATRFPDALLGISAQGWMRTWDATGRVVPAVWEERVPFLQRADVLFLSKEDVGGDEGYLDMLASEARLMVVTDGWRGATLYQGDMRIHVPPRPALEVDPTGAGDVFAAAFLLRLAECGDPFTAARFANVVASFSVTAPGWEAVPTREQVDAGQASEQAITGSMTGFSTLPISPEAG